MFPACFDTQEQYSGWIELAQETGIEEPELNFCFDCNPILKEYAINNGICTRPRTFFLQSEDEDGEVFLFGISVE